jgi:transposase
MERSEMLAAVQKKYELLRPHMDERTQRCWAATEARSIGWSGISVVAVATGISPHTIRLGLAEVERQTEQAEPDVPFHRIRRLGGGRLCLSATDPTLLHDLQALLASTTRGDPESPLCWTCKSTRNLAEELGRQGHQISHRTIATLLHELDYSLQANRKTREGVSHPDRNAQFEHINALVKRFQKRGQPVISVDTKKKELIGDFKNAGREWHRQKSPERVRSKDFLDPELGKVSPYGVYDLTANAGWVSVGVTHDTAQFATETIRRWWLRMGSRVYPRASQLLVTADGGGSNGSRSRLWKVSLQELADTLGLTISVCHFPPGTSKWNKIEHRMFCHITANWRGKPLYSQAVVVNLIANTKTRKGLNINAKLDANDYPTGIKVTDEELAAVNLTKDKFHGEWNYTIRPRSN